MDNNNNEKEKRGTWTNFLNLKFYLLHLTYLAQFLHVLKMRMFLNILKTLMRITEIMIKIKNK